MAIKGKKIDTVIFDMDGTVLDTLEDITDSVNYVMRSYGFPQHSISAIRSFIGNGMRKIIERALPAGSSAELCDEAVERYRSYYHDHNMIKTRPYDGIMELLQSFAQAGIKTAIVTNKNEDAAEKIYQQLFADTVDVCYGQKDSVPKKPDRAMIDLALRDLGSSAENAVYVGDSEVDLQTAANAGIPCITCLWGFRDREYLESQGADIFVQEPLEIRDLILG